MQQYSGPLTRHLQKYTGDGYVKEGRNDYLEERAVYIKQRFEIKQRKVASSEHDQEIGTYWYEEAEQSLIRPEVGDYVDFTQAHEFDEQSLNNTCQNVHFKPDNAFNGIDVDNEIELRLCPMLTEQNCYKNVTRQPDIVQNLQTFTEEKVEYDTYIPPMFEVQTASYGRFHFGWLNEVLPAQLGNHIGLAPLNNTQLNGNMQLSKNTINSEGKH